MYTKDTPKYFGYMPTGVEVNGQSAIYMSNGQLNIMTKEEFYEMVEQAKRFYDSEGIDEWIEKENNLNRWFGHPLLGTILVDGKYILPEPRIDKREFRKNLKRDWGFKCDWCEHKVSSKTDEAYFWINESITRDRSINGQCCSQACAENLWYDILIEWILDEKLTSTFHTDKTIKA